jgi:zinc transporter 1/2/3
LLAPASDALTNPCLTGPITEYDWAEGIALITIFTMFFIELMAARFEVFGEHNHDLESNDPSRTVIRTAEKGDAKATVEQSKWHIITGESS